MRVENIHDSQCPDLHDSDLELGVLGVGNSAGKPTILIQGQVLAKAEYLCPMP